MKQSTPAVGFVDGAAGTRPLEFCLIMAVTLVHVVAVALSFYAWRSLPAKPRQDSVISVSLSHLTPAKAPPVPAGDLIRSFTAEREPRRQFSAPVRRRQKKTEATRSARKTRSPAAVRTSPRKYRTPEEIRRDAVRRQPGSVPAIVTVADRTPAVDPGAIENRLLSKLGPLADSGDVPPADPSRYLQQVQAVLYKSWRQPSRSMVGNRDLSVSVWLTIRENGTIRRWTMRRRSGNLAMDHSVEYCLGSLQRLPPFPPGLTGDEISVNIRLQLHR